VLPPTSANLLDDETKPYFLWWVDASIADLRQHLASSDPAEKAYWLGAVLREANTRDVWLFTTPNEVTDLWPLLWRHLGKSRDLWCHLLELSPPQRRDEPR
jgi:hypothetical protein